MVAECEDRSMDPLRPKSRALAGLDPRGLAFRRRLGGAMLVVGGGAALIGILLPQIDSDAKTTLAGVAAGAALVGLLNIVRPRVLGSWGTPFFVAFAIVITTFGLHATGVAGDTTTDAQLLYALIVVYGFYFLPLTQSLPLLVLIAVCYGAVLLDQLPTDAAAIRWLLAITTLGAIGLLVRSLNARVEELILELGATARRDALTGVLNRLGADERL